MIDNSLWQKCVDFHGHACPGLAIGYKAAILAKEILNIQDVNDDEDIVCVSETDACGIDAFQVIFKATVGSGSMRIDYKGKNAFSVYDRKSNKSIRLVWKADINLSNREEKMNKILLLPSSDLFDIKDTKGDFPARAKIHKSIICNKCNEITAENAITNIDDKYYCKECI